MTSGRRLDLHVHSSYSPDGRSDVEELAAGAAAAGLDGFALTDHNSVAGLGRLAELRPRFPKLTFVPGVEVSTVEGHLLVLGVSELPPIRRPVAETVDWAGAHGAIAVPSHPFRRVHGVGTTVATGLAVPALEVLNGHTGAAANARARTLATARSVGGTGGSDAHVARELGRAWTAFPDGSTTVEEVLDALRRRATVAGGRSATATERWALGFGAFSRRLRRGLRPL